MKKISKKRLTIDRETVRELSSARLQDAHGAASPVFIPTQQQTVCYPCGSTLPYCGMCSSNNPTTIVKIG